jgi:hypothetical protein
MPEIFKPNVASREMRPSDPGALTVDYPITVVLIPFHLDVP